MTADRKTRRAHHPAGDDDDERRHLTVLFSDLSGSSRLGHAGDPEILDAVLSPVKREAARLIAAHGGLVVQFQGDGLLAVFGYPLSREDDVMRATVAALEVHAAVRDLKFGPVLPLGFEVRMHSGIHSGLVLLRQGDYVQGRLELVGETPNTAAGLCSMAAPDEILASASTLIGVLPFFETEPVASFALKGNSKPTDAYRVLGRSRVRTRFEASEQRGLAPFIGRQDALRSLEHALDRARAGRLSRVRIVGDAGIGKTRTVEELLRKARAQGAPVLSGYCESQGTSGPLWVFQQILRQALRLDPDPTAPFDLDEVTKRLEDMGLSRQVPPLLGLLSVGPVTPSLLAKRRPGDGKVAMLAFAALLDKLTTYDPLIVFLDDWQWADDTSRQVAAALQSALTHSRLLWIVATRPADTSQSISEGEEHIDLPPFRDIETAQAIDALSPSGLDLGIAAELHERSGGNPLYLEELCRTLTPREGPTNTAQTIPPTLHALIEARVHALPPLPSSVLRAAATIGATVPTWLLREITGFAEDHEVFDVLAANDLLYPGRETGTLHFKHGITRDAVYHSVKLAERRRLHASIAQALEERHAGRPSDLPHESLAYHYEGARDFSAAANHAEKAGDRARTRASLDRARLQYSVALAALDRLPPNTENLRRWLEISKRRAFTCVFNPAEDQLRMLQRAAEIGRKLDDLDAVAHAHFWHGFINYSLGNLPDSIAQYHRGIEVATQAGNAKLVTQLRANLGESLAASCEYEEAEKLLDESIESKRRLQSSPDPMSVRAGSAYAIACSAFIAADLGRSDEAEGLIEVALQATRGTRHPVAGSCLAIKSSILMMLGRFEECVEVAGEVESAGEQMNAPYLYGRGRSDRAFAKLMLTGNPDHIAPLREMTDWLEGKGIRLYQSLNYACLAEAHARVGQVDESRRYAQLTFERAAKLDQLTEAMAYRSLARAEALASPENPEPAERAIAQATEIARKRASAREIALIHATHAELLAARGERESARTALDLAYPELERMGLYWYASEARRLRRQLAS